MVFEHTVIIIIIQIMFHASTNHPHKQWQWKGIYSCSSISYIFLLGNFIDHAIQYVQIEY